MMTKMPDSFSSILLHPEANMPALFRTGNHLPPSLQGCSQLPVSQLHQSRLQQPFLHCFPGLGSHGRVINHSLLRRAGGLSLNILINMRINYWSRVCFLHIKYVGLVLHFLKFDSTSLSRGKAVLPPTCFLVLIQFYGQVIMHSKRL